MPGAVLRAFFSTSYRELWIVLMSFFFFLHIKKVSVKLKLKTHWGERHSWLPFSALFFFLEPCRRRKSQHLPVCIHQLFQRDDVLSRLPLSWWLPQLYAPQQTPGIHKDICSKEESFKIHTVWRKGLITGAVDLSMFIGWGGSKDIVSFCSRNESHIFG